MDTFGEHSGPWAGTNAFRMMPTDPPYEALGTADVRAAAGGNLTEIAYTWSHPESGEQSGLLVLGRGEDEGTAVALWGDSWHQAPAPRWLAGVVEHDTVTLNCTYAGDWGWTISVEAPGPDSLRLRMYNVVPESAAADGITAGPYWVMDGHFGRPD